MTTSLLLFSGVVVFLGWETAKCNVSIVTVADRVAPKLCGIAWGDWNAYLSNDFQCFFLLAAGTKEKFSLYLNMYANTWISREITRIILSACRKITRELKVPWFTGDNTYQVSRLAWRWTAHLAAWILCQILSRIAREPGKWSYTP